MDLKQGYLRTKDEIEHHARSTGSDPGRVTLLAVSKGRPVEKIRALYHCGQRDFGENYFQELTAKAEATKDLNIRWHYIGHLQSNKINRIVQTCSVIHTVASTRHGQLTAKAAREKDQGPYPVFIAVNTSGADQKSGCSREEALPLFSELKKFSELNIKGFMAVPSILENPHEGTLPDEYQFLKELAAKAGGVELSLGMTQDMALAIRAGSTCVRVGTGLFGPRGQF